MMPRILFILAVLICAAALVYAQGDIPAPIPVLPTLTPTATDLPPTVTPTARATVVVTTDPLLFAPQVEVAFPAGVRFSIRVIARSEAITGASITLERLNIPPQTTDLDLETAVTSDGAYSDLSYTWELTPSTFPRFYEEIDFRWSVRTADAVNTAIGTFTFTDARLLWDRRETRTGDLALSLPQNTGIARAIARIEPVIGAIRRDTGVISPLSFIVYDQATDPNGCIADADNVPFAFTPSGAAVRCLDRSLAQRIFAASDLHVARARTYAQDDVLDALTGGLIDQTYRVIWGDQRVPEWFVYGLTRLYAPTDHSAMLRVAQNAARSSQLLSLQELSVIPDDLSGQRQWQAQSLAMTLYITDIIGYDGIFELATALQTQSFERVYRQRMNQSTAGLIPEIRDWLFTSRADAAFRASPYGAPTLTPPPTATITPFPPTRTPRPEPSATPIPTITFTPSPRPTSTPTASVTPRPPNSIASATPAPIIENPQPNPISQTSIIAILGIVLAVLVILFARAGRR